MIKLPNGWFYFVFPLFFYILDTMAKILLAEDDLFIRDIYIEILQSGKYEVIPVGDGDEALNLIKQGGWDIVLLDMLMPKKTGLEVLSALKALNNRSLTKHILIMTNNEETKELGEFRDMYDDYILKSAITPGELLNKVKHFLNS